MRLKTLNKRTSEFEAKERAAGRSWAEDALCRRVDYVLYQATQNAEDTAVENPSFTEKDYEQVALNSLETLLGMSKDAEVQAWYRKQGFTW